MKMIYHKNMTPEKWKKFSFYEQMANIGSEVFRAINWQKKNQEYSRLAIERALELLDLTLETTDALRPRLKELARLREVLADYFYFDNEYGSSDKNWKNYFHAFNYAARNPAANKK